MIDRSQPEQFNRTDKTQDVPQKNVVLKNVTHFFKIINLCHKRFYLNSANETNKPTFEDCGLMIE